MNIVLFFLPLTSVHPKMRAEKSRLLHEIAARYPRLGIDDQTRKPNASLEDVQAGIAKLTNLQELEMLDRKVSLLPTWPYDIPILSKAIAIALSVTAVIVSREVILYLRIP